MDSLLFYREKKVAQKLLKTAMSSDPRVHLENYEWNVHIKYTE